MLVAVALLTVIVVMVVLVMLLLNLFYKMLKSIGLFHRGKDILTVKALPRGGYDGSLTVMLTDKLYALLNLMLLYLTGMGQNDAGGICNLIVIKLTEILHIHLALACIGNGGEAIKLCLIRLNLADSLNNVGELSYAGGFDYNSVGTVLLKNLSESLGKITDKGATDTARIHLGNLNARICKKSAVDAYLTEFVLYKNYLFTGKRLLKKLFNKSGLSRTEKAGKYVNFGHDKILFNYFYD